MSEKEIVKAIYGRMRFCTDGGFAHIHLEGLDEDRNVISDTVLDVTQYLYATAQIACDLADDILKAGDELPDEQSQHQH